MLTIAIIALLVALAACVIAAAAHDCAVAESKKDLLKIVDACKDAAAKATTETMLKITSTDPNIGKLIELISSKASRTETFELITLLEDEVKHSVAQRADIRAQISALLKHLNIEVVQVGATPGGYEAREAGGPKCANHGITLPCYYCDHGHKGNVTE